MNNQATIVGVLIPGDDRVRFCRTEVEGLRSGTWVRVSSGDIDEPGRVVAEPEQIRAGQSPRELDSVERRLSSEEIRQVSELSERASALLVAASERVTQLGPGLSLIGLRFNLGGTVAISRLAAEREDALHYVVAALSEHLGLPVLIERRSPTGNVYGGLGRLSSDPGDLATAVRARFDLDAPAERFRAEGLPRLGSRVQTAHGPGRLVSVAVRHGDALVRLERGEDISVPVSELTLDSD